MQQRVGVASRNPLSWDGLQVSTRNGFKSSCMNARLYDIGHQEILFSVIVKVLTNTCWVQAVLCLGCPIKIHCVEGVKRPCMAACQSFVSIDLTRFVCVNVVWSRVLAW